MTVLSEDLVLSKEHSLDTSHENTSLSVEIRVDLLLEGSLVGVTASDTHGESDSLLLCLSSDILEDGDGSVDSSSLLEEGSDGSARSLGGSEDDIDVLGWYDLGVILVDDGETVGEVQSLALLDVRGDVVPGLGLGSVREEIHDDGTLLESFVDGEEGLAWDLSACVSRKLLRAYL